MQVTKFVGISNNKKTFAKMSLIAVVLLYFGYQAVSGENGFLSYVHTKRLVEERQEVLDRVMSEYLSLERNVNLLSDTNLDLDLLEERCRIILNYSKAGEYIIKTRIRDCVE